MLKSYHNIKSDELTLRDRLAADRTMLANERTSLAYIRTILTAVVAGTTIIKFFDGIYYKLFGWCLIVLALSITLWGLFRCNCNLKDLKKLIKKS